MLEDQSTKIWEAWGTAGGNALRGFANFLVEKGMPEKEVHEMIDWMGYDMPEDVLRILTQTKSQVLLSAIFIADTLIFHRTKCVLKRGKEAKKEMPEEDLRKLLNWLGVGPHGQPKVQAITAKNRIFILKAIFNDY